MLRHLHAALLLLCAGTSAAQDMRISEGVAKEAVYRIVQHSGLLPNFVVRENSEVPTAIAFIKGRKRYIEYNPAFVSRIVDSTSTDWSAVSILAHEIAHHLLGHTLDPGHLHPGDELACDRYSGFVLCAMGAALGESMAAIEVAGDPHGTSSHPPRDARVEAVRQGWEDCKRLAENAGPIALATDEVFQFVVHFEGDENTYYVNANGRLVWYNNYAQPIEFGTFRPVTTGDFTHQLIWEDEVFFVDRHGNIWSRTAHQAQMNVGRLEAYEKE